MYRSICISIERFPFADVVQSTGADVIVPSIKTNVKAVLVSVSASAIVRVSRSPVGIIEMLVGDPHPLAFYQEIVATNPSVTVRQIHEIMPLTFDIIQDEFLLFGGVNCCKMSAQSLAGNFGVLPGLRNNTKIVTGFIEHSPAIRATRRQGGRTSTRRSDLIGQCGNSFL